jgi:hypothetical protein
VRWIGIMRLERKLLEHQTAGRAHRKHTARDMAGTNVNG